MLDYKLIEALAMVVQEGGFEKAARALHITQSAVSQRMRLLEDQMGQILLTRTTPPRATSAGRRIIKHYLQVKHLESDLHTATGKSADKNFSSIAVGINADSLATWLLDAVTPFLIKEKVLLDIRVDDQEQTHQLLKDGDVIGCISTRETVMQGCSIDYIGRMTYRMMATPQFARKWFPHGLAIDRTILAPAMVFNRKDMLHHKLLAQALGQTPAPIPTHYVPSAEKFADLVAAGVTYGMLPDQQSVPLLRSGQIIDLAPCHAVQVRLYWHCWNLKSALLEKLSRQMIGSGKTLLEKYNRRENR